MGHVRIGGASLYCEEHGAGSPILLIPPSGATASTWGRLAEALARAGRVIAYDRRGYTRSPAPVVHDVATHTADAAALLEALGAGPATVVGTSAGATIALDLAVRRPDLVHAVVVHEAAWRALRHPDLSGLGTLARMELFARQRWYDAAAAVLLQWVYSYRDCGSAWDAFPADWRRIAMNNGESVVADLHASMGSYPRRAQLASIRCPVVCTYGSRSRAPAAFARIVIEELPDGRLHMPAAFREPGMLRRRRQVVTVARTVQVGLARARGDGSEPVKNIDGHALRNLVATVAADARLVDIPVRRPPWAPTGLQVTAGDQVSWLG